MGRTARKAVSICGMERAFDIIAGKDEKRKGKCMAELVEYLKRAVQDGASDLFIVAGGKVAEKVEKTLYPRSEERRVGKEC